MDANNDKKISTKHKIKDKNSGNKDDTKKKTKRKKWIPNNKKWHTHTQSYAHAKLLRIAHSFLNWKQKPNKKWTEIKMWQIDIDNTVRQSAITLTMDIGIACDWGQRKRERERKWGRKWGGRKMKNSITPEHCFRMSFGIVRLANWCVIKCHNVAKANTVAGISNSLWKQNSVRQDRTKRKNKSHCIDIKPLKWWRSQKCSKLPNIKRRALNRERKKGTGQTKTLRHVYIARWLGSKLKSL